MADDSEDGLALSHIAAAVRAEPGDTVIVVFTRSLSQQDAEQIRDRWEQCVPGISLVVAADIAELQVRRSDGITEAAVPACPAATGTGDG